MGKKLAANAWAVLMVALCGLFLFCERSWFFLGPEYTLERVSSADLGQGGSTLVIDQGRSALEVLTGEGSLERRYTGSSLFDAAELAVQGEDGALYVADRTYENDGEDGASVEMVERIVQLQGSRSRVIWQKATALGENTERMRYPILEMQARDGALTFLRRESYGVGLYRVVPGWDAELLRQIYSGDVIDDASVDLDTGTVVIAVRRGFVRWSTEDGMGWTTLYGDGERLMPEKIVARGGAAYFTDLYEDRLCRFVPGEADSLTTVLTGKQLQEVQLSPDGKQVLACSTDGLWLLEDGETREIRQVGVKSFPVTVMTWLALAGLLGSLAWLLRRVPGHIGKVFRRESAVRALLVVLAAASVSAFVGYSLLSELFVGEDTTLIDSMKLFSETVRQQVDVEALDQLEAEWDYGSSAYQEVRRGLDGLMDLAWSENNYYSYALYRADDGTARYLVDSDDTVKVGQPAAAEDGEYLRRVQETGRAYALRREDADGVRTSLLLPVEDESGQRRGVLEVSLDMALRDRERARTVFNMVLNVICSTAVVVMLVMEGLFLLSFFESRRKRRKDQPEGLADGPAVVPLRTLMCVSYLADAMQDAFIAILCTELYQGGLPLPDSMAVALPLSAQLLLMAVTSAFAGRFAERMGSRPVLMAGMGLQLAGSLTCMALGSYYGLLFGKMMIGAGMGIIYVTCNTVAASGASEESVSGGFAGVAAGTLSGLTIGGGLSSVFFSIGGWRMIYAIGAIFLTAGLLLAASSQDVKGRRQGTEWEEAVERQDISLVRFFFNRRVLGFFVLILVPFMMALAYREYFFPLFAQENGMSEVRIGQVYLLCGLLVIYLGPKISQWMLARLGALNSVILASVAMGANMLLYVAAPSMGSVLAGVVILSVIISFAYTCQYTYFEDLPDSTMVGQGKAMGVYSVFESLGQTVGPMAYGALLVLGQRQGILVFSAAMLGLAGLFIFIMWRGRHVFR